MAQHTQKGLQNRVRRLSNACMTDELSYLNKLTVPDKAKKLEALRLAKEYVVDFSLGKAAMRCNMEINRARQVFKEPIFEQSVTDWVNSMEEELVISKNEVLMGIKKEAYNFEDGTPQSRINAFKEMARLLRMDPAEHHVHTVQAEPIINLTLHGQPESQLTPTTNQRLPQSSN